MKAIMHALQVECSSCEKRLYAHLLYTIITNAESHFTSTGGYKKGHDTD